MGPKSFIYKPWYGPCWNWLCLTHVLVSKLQRSIYNYETDLKKKKETEFNFISCPGLHQFSVTLGYIFCLHLRKPPKTTGFDTKVKLLSYQKFSKLFALRVLQTRKINKTHSQFCRICKKSLTPGKEKGSLISFHLSPRITSFFS